MGGRSYLVTWSIYGREELLSYLVNIWERGVTKLLGQYLGERSYSVTWSIFGREELLSYLVNIWEEGRIYSNTLSLYLKSIYLKNSKFFRGSGGGAIELEHVLSEQKLK